MVLPILCHSLYPCLCLCTVYLSRLHCHISHVNHHIPSLPVLPHSYTLPPHSPASIALLLLHILLSRKPRIFQCMISVSSRDAFKPFLMHHIPVSRRNSPRFGLLLIPLSASTTFPPALPPQTFHHTCTLYGHNPNE